MMSDGLAGVASDSPRDRSFTVAIFVQCIAPAGRIESSGILERCRDSTQRCQNCRSGIRPGFQQSSRNPVHYRPLDLEFWMESWTAPVINLNFCLQLSMVRWERSLAVTPWVGVQILLISHRMPRIT